MTGQRSAIILLLGLWLLSGCASRPADTGNNPLAQSVDDVISRLGTSLPGQYSNFAQHRLDQSVPRLQLNISRRDTPGQFLVEQSALLQSLSVRQFIWQFSRTPTAELLLEFAPLINGQTAQSCRVVLLPSPDGISGSTNQQNCRLPNRDNQPIGLLKEFLLNPDRIDLGERLYNLETSSALRQDTRLEFRRQLNYSGWAGKQDEASDEWRLAQPFTLHNQGDVVLLKDSAERSLGYKLELARIVYRADQPEVLRLAVIDEQTGKQVAYAWASTDADRVGINLGWLQVGMERITGSNAAED